MKPTKRILPRLLVICCLLTGISFLTGLRSPEDPPATIANNFINGNTPAEQDTTPKVSDALKALQGLEKAAKITPPKIGVPKVQAPKVDTKFFGKILNLFKFRKNAHAREDKRVRAIFDSLGVNQSIQATADNLRLLVGQLAMLEANHYDSIGVRYDSLDTKIDTLFSMIKRLIPVPAASEPPDQLVAAPASNEVPADADSRDLANKIFPIIADKEKRMQLAAIRKVLESPKSIQYIKDTAKHLVHRYELVVNNKAEVYGIHNYNSSDYSGYQFGLLDGLIYQALFVNGNTGNFKSLNGWDSAFVISAAQQAGCKVLFTAKIDFPASLRNFLNNEKAEKNFVDNVIQQLKARKANGVNIQFTGLGPSESESFRLFMKFLSQVLKMQDNSFEVFLTLPAVIPEETYDFKQLSGYVDRFLVDFSEPDTAQFRPIAPLQGKGFSLAKQLTDYLSQAIPPEKLIVTLPYSGVYWGMRADKSGLRVPKYLQTYTYSDIQQHFNWPLQYDETGSARMDSSNQRGQKIRTLWFDNAATLENKYDFILQNGLGGVCVNALGYDKGYPDLWNAMAYKFAQVDTSFLPDSVLGMHAVTHLNLLQKAARYLTLFRYIMDNPCEICFENIKNPEYAAVINKDLDELRIDSLILVANQGVKETEQYRSRFDYVNDQLTSFLLIWNVLFLLAFVIICVFYVYKNKTAGEEWPWKRKIYYALLALSLLCVFNALAYVFADNQIPVFGSVPPKTDTRSKAPIFSQEVLMLKKAVGDTTMPVAEYDTNYCVADPTISCYNIPFTTLLIVSLISLILGGIITKYFIVPLFKRNDIP
ncbi:MAG TPA: glycosyl hydrolase family 18 protein [Sediminibacterium sp.]|nr:glycosyl hydrolase family 18 protein [Sediminibacterium sp.]